MSRIVALGHSCGGTIALQIAENDARVTACVAYAPIVNLEAHTRRGLDAITGIEQVREAQYHLSPERGIARLRCPTFLFVAEDDLAVPVIELDPFGEKLTRLNTRAVYEKAAHGGHTDAVEEVGMPRAIAWLASLPELRPRPPSRAE